jgi:hypothetical protein
VKGALHIVANHLAAKSEMGAEMSAVCVKDVYFPRSASESY